jgi:predicted RNA-binding Zn-ribbon protein involved in translation (DUF1610 family)
MIVNIWPFQLGAFGGRNLRNIHTMGDETTKFDCPTCRAEYWVVRVEAAPMHNNQLLCLSCGGHLRSREGKFALKYFRVSDGANPDRKTPRRPKS